MCSHAVAAVLVRCKSAVALAALVEGCAGLSVPSAVAAVQHAVTAMQGRGERKQASSTWCKGAQARPAQAAEDCHCQSHWRGSTQA